jgi:hypothetical protein
MTLSAHSKLIVFGDGLSDQGRFGALTHNRYPPSPPFAGGRWTNGLTWVEVLSQRLNLPLDPEDNFAQGGATTGWYNINEPLRQALGLAPDAPIRGVLAQVTDALWFAHHSSILPRCMWCGLAVTTSATILSMVSRTSLHNHPPPTSARRWSDWPRLVRVTS